MRYRLSIAQLVGETIGAEVAPGGRATIDVLAENLPATAAIYAAAGQFRRNWRSSDSNSPESVMEHEAVPQLNQVLAAVGAYTVVTLNPYYKPIYDATGAVVGHMVIGWLFNSGARIRLDIGGGNALLVCMIVSIVGET